MTEAPILTDMSQNIHSDEVDERIHFGLCVRCERAQESRGQTATYLAENFGRGSTS